MMKNFTGTCVQMKHISRGLSLIFSSKIYSFKTTYGQKDIACSKLGSIYFPFQKR